MLLKFFTQTHVHEHWHLVDYENGFLNDLHHWFVHNHIWAVPLVLFFFVVGVSLLTMKIYLWWRFDRKK